VVAGSLLISDTEEGEKRAKEREREGERIGLACPPV
jgi:hypothetical protein